MDCSLDWVTRDLCGPWHPAWKFVYQTAHWTIFSAYAVISAVFAYTIATRKATPVDPELSLLSGGEKRELRLVFAAFFLLCGVGHWMEGDLAFRWADYHAFAAFYALQALVAAWGAVLAVRYRTRLTLGV